MLATTLEVSVFLLGGFLVLLGANFIWARWSDVEAWRRVMDAKSEGPKLEKARRRIERHQAARDAIVRNEARRKAK